MRRSTSNELGRYANHTKMDENSEHAKVGLNAQAFVYYKLKELLPNARVLDCRDHLKELGVTNERDLNYFEKTNGDIWVCLAGKLFRIEVCSGMPGKLSVSVGESKENLFAGEFYCFITHTSDGDLADVCWAKRQVVKNYLEKILTRRISKTGGEDYKMFYSQTFRNAQHSFAEFVSHLSSYVI